MKPMTAEWVAKAEGDFATLERESRVRKDPNYDGICFHAQQCAEKYLKARLCEAGRRFTKIHGLVALLELVLPVESRRGDNQYLHKRHSNSPKPPLAQNPWIIVN